MLKTNIKFLKLKEKKIKTLRVNNKPHIPIH